VAEFGVQCHQFLGNHLLPPGTVRKSDGGMYHVFTPYKRQYIKCLQQAYQAPWPIPEAKKQVGSLGAEPVAVEMDLGAWPVGERAVNQLVRRFMQQVNYDSQRDYPGVAGTSRLSPYLANGVISPRVCLAHALKEQGEAAFDSVWVSELIWREFYHDLMHEYPRLAKGEAFSAKATDQWQHRPEVFAAWQQGRTGFPIIDAGMRELRQTGWMHNRLRMVVGSFLVKNLQVHWSYGEKWFWDTLVDADLSNNVFGWQWVAGCGLDAAPFFRIFNPLTQSRKFDPEGTFLRKFLPELKDCDRKEIHDPLGLLEQSSARKKASRLFPLSVEYPEPIVCLKETRADTLAKFRSLNES